MALRLVLVGVVASLGLTLPSKGTLDCWSRSSQAWLNARLAEWESRKPVDEGAFVFVAEPVEPARLAHADEPAEPVSDAFVSEWVLAAQALSVNPAVVDRLELSDNWLEVQGLVLEAHDPSPAPAATRSLSIPDWIQAAFNRGVNTARMTVIRRLAASAAPAPPSTPVVQPADPDREFKAAMDFVVASFDKDLKETEAKAIAAANARKAAEAEKARQVATAEKARKAAEAEKARLVAEAAEKARKAAEAEKARLVAEAAAKARQAADAEKARLVAEAAATARKAAEAAAELDRAFNQALDEAIASFVKDGEKTTVPPAVAVAAESLAPEGPTLDDDLWMNEAFDFVPAPESAEVTAVKAPVAPPAIAQAKVEAVPARRRWDDALRLTREAVDAWVAVLHGPAVVSITR
jgi:hypothetical protein